MSPHQPPRSHHPSQHTQKQESFPHPLLGPIAPGSSLACFSPPASELALPSLDHHWVPPQLLCPAGPPAYLLLSMCGENLLPAFPGWGGGGVSQRSVCRRAPCLPLPQPRPQEPLLSVRASSWTQCSCHQAPLSLSWKTPKLHFLCFLQSHMDTESEGLACPEGGPEASCPPPVTARTGTQASCLPAPGAAVKIHNCPQRRRARCQGIFFFFFRLINQ